MIQYHLKVHQDGDTLWGEFPDLEGCFTDGTSRKELAANAAEALIGWIGSVIERGFKIPKPTYRNPGSVPVALPLSMGVALQLRWMREAEHLSQQEVAHRLGISYQAYQRFENPVKANPSLKTLEKLARLYHVPPEQLLRGPSTPKR